MRSRRFLAFVAVAALTGALPLFGLAWRAMDGYEAPPTEVATAIDSGTTLELTASPEVVERGELTLTATVHPVSGSLGTPKRGSVVFMVGSKVLGSAPIDTTSVAQITTAAPLAGEYRIVASYGGSPRFEPSDASTTLRVIAPGSEPAGGQSTIEE